jgi:uncharacterized protein YbjT (DUF2867 family)
MSTVGIILVTGSTGKQGRALIRALQGPETKARFRVLALTRNASSPAAKALLNSTKETSNAIELVEGNLDDASSIRRIFEDAKHKGGIWGVFGVLAYAGLGVKADGEESQGKVGITKLLEADCCLSRLT